jgi:AcrR family transcriptional regulator
MTDHRAPATERVHPATNHRGPGRPRDPEVDRSILRAVVEVMAEAGLAGTTVSAVAQRAGVARATIYLRWPTREALLGAMARAAGGGFPYPLTGDLERDIRRGADFAREVTSGEHFIDVLPELFAAVLGHPQQLSFDAIAPNRKRVAAEYRALAAEQGFDPSLDADLAFDMILGAELIYILGNRKAPPARYVRQLAEVVIAGTRLAKPSAPADNEAISPD